MTHYVTATYLVAEILSDWVQSCYAVSSNIRYFFPLMPKYSLHGSKYFPATAFSLQRGGTFHAHKTTVGKTCLLKRYGLTLNEKVPGSNPGWNGEYPDLLFVAPQPQLPKQIPE
jgi:hypothetical protein